MPDLRHFLDRTFAASGGVLSFDEFMAAALYDPEHGYYTTGIGDVGGRGGDFATSATLSAGLARAIAGWIAEEITRLSWSGPVAVIEVGGGNGALAASVLKSLGWWRRRSIRYHLVEVSPVLRELQQAKLVKRRWSLSHLKERGRPRPRTEVPRPTSGPGAAPLLEHGQAVVWHESIADALAACGGRALIFSNELVDAFPAKWLRWDGTRWEEVCVSYEPSQGLGEIFRELQAGLSADHFSALALTKPPLGQRIEILPSFRKWLQDLAPHWLEGTMLTIDYGADSAEIIYDRRPGGTMRAYYRQQRIEGGGIYARFGRQDLTSDVNFADLVRWGEELGWETAGLGTQWEFLQRHGAETDLVAGDGVGEAFRVLALRNQG
jgi:SAM-dependent MidA family methyltransferase